MSNVQILNSLAQWETRLLAQQIDPGRRLLWVDITRQTLYVCEAGEIIDNFPVSTALRGTGCEQDSYQTPVGLHQVSDKIGEGEPLGMLFKGREAQGLLVNIEATAIDTGDDQITSRILWLSGMEPGINQGEGVDTHDRYIYIHGTNEEGRIGKSVSHGCVRMKNADVIELFAQVEKGTVVIIE